MVLLFICGDALVGDSDEISEAFLVFLLLPAAAAGDAVSATTELFTTTGGSGGATEGGAAWWDACTGRAAAAGAGGGGSGAATGGATGANGAFAPTEAAVVDPEEPRRYFTSSGITPDSTIAFNFFNSSASDVLVIASYNNIKVLTHTHTHTHTHIHEYR